MTCGVAATSRRGRRPCPADRWRRRWWRARSSSRPRFRAGQPQQRDRLPGRLDARLRPGPDDPRCQGRHLEGDVRPAGRWVRLQGRDQQVVGRELRCRRVHDGSDIPFDHPGGPVTFYYDHGTHWITNDVLDPIITAPGSFQSELGCPGDWAPDCMRSWLQDLEGDGTYTFTTTQLPAGAYEVKVTHGLSWAENYGAGGARDGANIAFTVPGDGMAVHLHVCTGDPPPHGPYARGRADAGHLQAARALARTGSHRVEPAERHAPGGPSGCTGRRRVAWRSTTRP